MDSSAPCTLAALLEDAVGELSGEPSSLCSLARSLWAAFNCSILDFIEVPFAKGLVRGGVLDLGGFGGCGASTLSTAELDKSSVEGWLSLVIPCARESGASCV